MFFRAHNEGKIGYKKLTNADLGKSTGNTTHIGLFGDILTYLPDRDFEDTAMFIYNGKAEPLGFSFDRIENPDGSFRSPKIKKGGKNIVSVVTFIQDIVKNEDDNLNWFLIWFGLESEEVVFYLFNNESEDFSEISKSIDLNKGNVKGRVDSSEHRFNFLVTYLENIVNQNNIDTIKELEIVSQVGSSKKYRAFDIEKANKNFSEIGRFGEELVNEYLEKQKTKGFIFNYSWVNRDKETGLPYDFTIQHNNQNIIYIDVKSTSFKFDQPMIFSNQEIDFICVTPYHQIFRVYGLSEECKSLRICENSKNFIPKLNPSINTFKSNLQQFQVNLLSAKFALKPTIDDLKFNSEVKF
ncbi:MAG: DUF3883 domain-containing protein [Flavobacterium sp.]|uniref:protein NO VEIN domain-containing protein n=1 Tax=Flavobacterium sp. TaxID=239 RepID=UPI0032648332